MKDSLKKVKDIIRRVIKGGDKKEEIATYPDDVFLVSYPKSGNTWMRFLVGNYMTGGKVGFSNVIELMPELQTNPEQCAKVEMRPRFIKSHRGYNRKYPKAVYILRDGRDVAVSSYYHLVKQGEITKDTPFPVFLRTFATEGIFRLGSWSSHVESWLRREGKGNVIFVKYEDMLEDPGRELEKVLRFAGVEVDPERVKRAVKASSFEEMQRSEKEEHDAYFGKYGFKNRDVKFVRKGQKGDWRSHFTKEDEETFLKVHGRTMRKLGYIE